MKKYKVGDIVQIVNHTGIYIPSSAEGQQAKIISAYDKQSTRSYLLEVFHPDGHYQCLAAQSDLMQS